MGSKMDLSLFLLSHVSSNVLHPSHLFSFFLPLSPFALSDGFVERKKSENHLPNHREGQSQGNSYLFTQNLLGLKKRTRASEMIPKNRLFTFSFVERSIFAFAFPPAFFDFSVQTLSMQRKSIFRLSVYGLNDREERRSVELVYILFLLPSAQLTQLNDNRGRKRGRQEIDSLLVSAKKKSKVEPIVIDCTFQLVTKRCTSVCV